MVKKLIQIGESIHGSIPKPQAAMKELLKKGPGALETPGEELDFIISLINAQREHKADYIEINVDAFGEDDPQVAVEMMRDYVRLVKKHSQGVPVCVDSSSDDVLKAGLEEWYNDPAPPKALPLLNSVKTYTIDEILPLRQNYPFKVIGLLIGDEDSGMGDVEFLFSLARKIFQAAAGKYGFQADDVFFDTTVFPLAIDMPMSPGQSGYTYRAFETIRRIMNDPDMQGVHTSLGISNCVKDLPGRKIGVCRAYLALAQQYGLDAAIVNVMHDYGLKAAPPELLELVEAFALQDGTPEASQRAMEIMGNFCRTAREN